MNPLAQSFVLALLLGVVGVAAADGVAPGGDHLARLDSKLSVVARARITTKLGIAVVGDVRGTPEGISYQNLMVSLRSDSLRGPGVIAWEEIDRVETSDGTTSFWLKPWTLAFAGAGLGLVAFAAAGGTTTSWTESQSPTPFFVAGAAVGFGFGLFARRFGAHWRTIYP